MSLPKEFQQAVLKGDVDLVDRMIAPLRMKVKEEELLRRLDQDPFDVEAQKLLEDMIKRGNIEENLSNALEHTPESFIQVHMLYIPAIVNGTKVSAFVDSGAQMTIMSKSCAEKCGLLRLLDTRYSGVAQGVGTAKILGKVHLTQMILGKTHFPVTITVLDQGGIEFLLGLDMLRRHGCCIDLKNNCLNIGSESVQFISEKDLPAKMSLLDNSPIPFEVKKDSKPINTTPQTNVFVPNSEYVKSLMDLGFTKTEAENALKMTNNNLDAAAGLMFQ